MISWVLRPILLAFINDHGKMIRLTKASECTDGRVVAIGRFERTLLAVNCKFFVEGAGLTSATAQFAQINLKWGC